MFRTVGMAEFYQETKIKKLSIVDVREEDEYQLGHIPDALNLPLSAISDSFQVLNQEQEYYLICQAGSRSEMACRFLASKGYQVVNVMGGTSAWMGTLE